MLQSKLAATMGNYPFEKCLEYLQSKGVVEQYDPDRTGRSHRETLLSQMGMIRRQGSPEGRRLLRRAIRRFLNGDDGGRRREMPVSDISRFTSVLKEHGDHLGKQPKYTEERASIEPTEYRVRVTLGDVTGEGRARSKKQAKHLASQEACRRLNLTNN